MDVYAQCNFMFNAQFNGNKSLCVRCMSLAYLSMCECVFLLVQYKGVQVCVCVCLCEQNVYLSDTSVLDYVLQMCIPTVDCVY